VRNPPNIGHKVREGLELLQKKGISRRDYGGDPALKRKSPARRVAGRGFFCLDTERYYNSGIE
jgi:hypothetical protein